MNIEIREEDQSSLDAYAAITISFRVDRLAVPVASVSSTSGLSLEEKVQAPPFVKDYDSIPGNHPRDWPERFDLSNWAIFSAWDGAHRSGGVVIAHGTPAADLLERRSDLAVVWDIRVTPQLRGRGVGHALLQAAEAWALSKSCTELKVETQNINAPACRFYSKNGFELRVANPGAYPGFPNEVQLLWHKQLPPQARRRRSGPSL